MITIYDAISGETKEATQEDVDLLCRISQGQGMALHAIGKIVEQLKRELKINVDEVKSGQFWAKEDRKPESYQAEYKNIASLKVH